MILAEINYTVHVALTLPKQPIIQFKLVQQSRQKAQRTYCPNIYTVYLCARELDLALDEPCYTITPALLDTVVHKGTF